MKFPKEFDYHGGIKALAEGVGVSPTTVCGWRRDNKIPRHQRIKVAGLAARERMDDVPIKPAPEPKKPEPKLSDIAGMIAAYLKAMGV